MVPYEVPTHFCTPIQDDASIFHSCPNFTKIMSFLVCTHALPNPLNMVFSHHYWLTLTHPAQSPSPGCHDSSHQSSLGAPPYSLSVYTFLHHHLLDWLLISLPIWLEFSVPQRQKKKKKKKVLWSRRLYSLRIPNWEWNKLRFESWNFHLLNNFVCGGGLSGSPFQTPNSVFVKYIQ